MVDTQEINLLLEFDSKTGALQTCKIISNIKDLILSNSVSLINITNESSNKIGKCNFCMNGFEIFLYQSNNVVSKAEQKIEETFEPLVRIKEEVFAEPIEVQPIDSVQEKKIAVVDSESTSVTSKKRQKDKNKPKSVRKSKVFEQTEDGYFKCDLCKSEFFSSKSCARHRFDCDGSFLGRFKTGPNPQCSFCEKTYTSWYQVRIHEKKIHLRTLSYTCEVCGYFTTSKSSFVNHELRGHKNIQKHVSCDLCGFRCSNKNWIRSHMKLKHLKIGMHVCEICSKEFATVTAWRHHCKYRHSDERNFPCEKCGKAFKTQDALRYHDKKVHLPLDKKKSFACDVCGYATQYKESLEKHKGLHMDANDCPFKCLVCKRGFMSKHAFNDHMLVHSNVRAFKCEFCEKTFKRKADLKIHTRYHTGEKPYECEICAQRYSDRGCYRSHLIAHEKQLGVVLDKSVKKFINISN